MTNDQKIARYEAAKAAAEAALVPDEDRAGPGTEPVRVTGWYRVPTVSGRPAWALYVWRAGRCVETRCTYDLAVEGVLKEIAALGVWE